MFGPETGATVTKQPPPTQIMAHAGSHHIMTSIHQQRIRELLHGLEKIQPQELAPILASYYTNLTFGVANRQLQLLADTLSSISVAVSRFVLDIDWKRREESDAATEEEETRKAMGPQGCKLLSVSQVADMLGVKKQKVYRMLKEGNLPSIDVNAGTGKRPLIRIRANEVSG